MSLWSPFFFFFLLELSWESVLPALWFCALLLVESLLEVDASFTWGGGGTAAGVAGLLLLAAPLVLT